ncbi:hypothetical protein Trydic_g9117 [Trypoxylus dichotomus]
MRTSQCFERMTLPLLDHSYIATTMVTCAGRTEEEGYSYVRVLQGAAGMPMECSSDTPGRSILLGMPGVTPRGRKEVAP